MRGYPTKPQQALALSSLTALVMLSASPAHAVTFITTCSQTLSTPGTYVLKTDLTCPGATTGVVINASNVTLHLVGHTITGDACNGNGIVVNGGFTGITVDGGTVRGFIDGIVLYSANSRVTAMTVTKACTFGLAISGTSNQVDTSSVTLSGMDGIGIGAASGIVIRSNYIADNARVGVDISNGSSKTVVQSNIISRNGLTSGQGGVALFNGAGNVITGNSLDGNFNGIEVEAPSNTVSGNVLRNTVQTGIFVTSVGTPSSVISNVVYGSGFVDMSDDSPTCGTDTWQKNSFLTDLAGGVPNGGPGVGCIQ
jgi:hypothetical protein